MKVGGSQHWAIVTGSLEKSCYSFTTSSTPCIPASICFSAQFNWRGVVHCSSIARHSCGCSVQPLRLHALLMPSVAHLKQELRGQGCLSGPVQSLKCCGLLEARRRGVCFRAHSASQVLWLAWIETLGGVSFRPCLASHVLMAHLLFKMAWTKKTPWKPLTGPCGCPRVHEAWDSVTQGDKAE